MKYCIYKIPIFIFCNFLIEIGTLFLKISLEFGGCNNYATLEMKKIFWFLGGAIIMQFCKMEILSKKGGVQ